MSLEFIDDSQVYLQCDADHREVNVFLFSKATQSMNIFWLKWNEFCQFTDSGITRSAVDMIDSRALVEFPYQCVFTTAVTDD